MHLARLASNDILIAPIFFSHQRWARVDQGPRGLAIRQRGSRPREAV